MAFTVRTFPDETTLQAVIGGTVTTYPDEQTLSDGIAAATSVDYVMAKGEKFTLVDSPTLPNIVAVITKGGKYTLVDGTP